MDLKKDPVLISGPMTGSLVVYSLVFMRYAYVQYLLGFFFSGPLRPIFSGFKESFSLLFRFTISIWYLLGDDGLTQKEEGPILNSMIESSK